MRLPNKILNKCMILPTLVLAYILLSHWAYQCAEKTVTMLRDKFPMLKKYILALTPFAFVTVVTSLALLLQLALCFYIFLLGRALSNPLLYKVLYFDVSALNPLQTLKWSACGMLAAAPTAAGGMS